VGYDRTYQRCASCGEPYWQGSQGLHFKTKEPPSAEFLAQRKHTARVASRVVARFEAMKQVGTAGVDSGTLLVIDPCYLDKWGTGEHPELSYDAIKQGLTQLHFSNGAEAGVVIRGFGGDGGYPVLIEDTSAAKAADGGAHFMQNVGSFVVDLMPDPETAARHQGMDPLAARVAAKYKDKKKTDKGNTVYMYSERQIAERNKKKAERIEKLRKSIGKLRTTIKRDMKSSDPEKSLTALAVALMDHTYERVGNDESAKDGHFGVTGWKKKHITFGPKGATIKYVGKSGVKHEKKVTDPGIKNALKDAYEACDGDNNCLFSGDWGTVSAEKVNEYLDQFDITAKDLRGFHANREMQERLKAIRGKGKALPEEKKAKEKLLKAEFLEALEASAEAVGHEPATLRSQYLVPGLEESYMKDGSVSDKLSVALDPEGTIEERLAARFMLGLL
jgi:hypothetical protein